MCKIRLTRFWVRFWVLGFGILKHGFETDPVLKQLFVILMEGGRFASII